MIFSFKSFLLFFFCIQHAQSEKNVFPSFLQSQTYVCQVVAKVGRKEKAITSQDVMERIRLTLSSSKQKPTETMKKSLFSATLRLLIDEELQRQAAERAGIKVSKKEIEKRFSLIESQSGMKKGELDAFLSLHKINKETFMKQIEGSLLWINYIEEKYGRNINISQQNINKFQEKWKKDHERTLYRIAEIVIDEELIEGKDSKKKAHSLAQSVRSLLNEGVSFIQLARQFSHASSRDQGGLLGWRGAHLLPSYCTPSWLQEAEIGIIKGPFSWSPDGSKDPQQRKEKLIILALLDRKEPRELSLSLPSSEEVLMLLRADALSLRAQREVHFLHRTEHVSSECQL